MRQTEDSGNYLGRFEFCDGRILYNIGVPSLKKEFKITNIKISTKLVMIMTE